MCSRFGIISDGERLKERFKLDQGWDLIEKRTNIPPSAQVPVILRRSPNRVELMKWGLLPSWSKTSTSKFSLINIRDDSFDTKPYFRKLLGSQRVIIACDYYFEWKPEGTGKEAYKQPYRFSSNTGDMLAIAGIYDQWEKDGIRIDSFAMITTSPNKEAARVHDRQPVLLNPLEEDTWLDQETSLDTALRLIDKAPDDILKVERVDRVMNSPRYQGEIKVLD